VRRSFVARCYQPVAAVRRGIGPYSGRISKSGAIFDSGPEDRAGLPVCRNRARRFELIWLGYVPTCGLTARTGWDHRATKRDSQRIRTVGRAMPAAVMFIGGQCPPYVKGLVSR
jgi:hypothetical protein